MTETDVRCWAIVPAAGSGSRFDKAQPKQYAMLAGTSLLEHVLTTLRAHENISGIVVLLAPGINPDFLNHSLSSELLSDKKIHFANGGNSRADSVLNGLNFSSELANTNDFVLVHDAARPLLHQKDLSKLITLLHKHPVGGILATPVVDTIKHVDEAAPPKNIQHHTINETRSRDQLWAAQTPQMFRLKLLRTALQKAIDDQLDVTDESMAMEQMGYQPVIIPTQYSNFKITHAKDLLLAEAVLDARRAGGSL